MKFTATALGAAMVLAASGAQAQSAKFAADWKSDSVTLVELEQIGPGSTSGIGTGLGATEILATIKVPNGKELLIGVSGVANLVTFTQAKGKNGGNTTTAKASGTMQVEVKYGPTGSDICADGATAAPGKITFASRVQELSVTTDLYLSGDVYDGDSNLVAIDGDVTVALGLDTTAAHHFNFVAYDLASGEYDIAACFDATGLAEVTGIDADVDSIAQSKVAIAHRMITIQEVRAVKTDDPISVGSGNL